MKILHKTWLIMLITGLINGNLSAIAQQVQTGYTIGISSQVSSSTSHSIDVRVNDGGNYAVSGSNVRTTDGTNILVPNATFLINDSSKPFSLAVEKGAGGSVGVSISNSSAFTEGNSASITVFSSF